METEEQRELRLQREALLKSIKPNDLGNYRPKQRTLPVATGCDTPAPRPTRRASRHDLMALAALVAFGGNDK